MTLSRSDSSEGRTAFTIAASILGLLALGQVAAVAIFVMRYEVRDPLAGENPARVAVPDGPRVSLTAPASPEPVINRTRPVAIAPVDPSSTQPPVPAPSPGPRPEISDEVAVQNKAALTYLDKGMALREQGDMRGALVQLRAAASLEPNHPRVLYEFAITFEQMGLTEKAVEFWRGIYELGQVRGGDYYLLADFRLKGKTQKPDTETIPEASDRVLKLTRAVAERDLSVAEGERVVLNVLITAVPGANPDPRDVHVRVDFYDTVNETSVDLTRAIPANRWVTQPIDWKGQSEELLEVSYYLPPQSESDILEFGKRKYHGYIVRIYYRDQIQDVVAEPRTLLDLNERKPERLEGGLLGAPGLLLDESLFPQ